MPTTLGLFLIMAYGAFVGAMLENAFHLSPSSWASSASVVRDLTTALGIVVGGWWAYRKYFQKREAMARADLNHQIVTLELEGQLLMRVVLEIKNVGQVEIKSAGGDMLVQRPTHPLVIGDGDPHKSWETIRQIHFPFVDDGLCLEPGTSERYSRDFVIDGDVRIVQIHSRVFSQDDKEMWDETTVHELKPKAVAA